MGLNASEQGAPMCSTGLSFVLATLYCTTSLINGCRTDGPIYDPDPVKTIHRDKDHIKTFLYSPTELLVPAVIVATVDKDEELLATLDGKLTAT